MYGHPLLWNLVKHNEWNIYLSPAHIHGYEKVNYHVSLFRFNLCILKYINNILFHLYEKFDVSNDELWGTVRNDELWGTVRNILKKERGILFSLEWNYYYFPEFFSFDFASNLPWYSITFACRPKPSQLLHVGLKPYQLLHIPIGIRIRFSNFKVQAWYQYGIFSKTFIPTWFWY
jgi:hypothetical protein